MRTQNLFISFLDVMDRRPLSTNFVCYVEKKFFSSYFFFVWVCVVYVYNIGNPNSSFLTAKHELLDDVFCKMSCYNVIKFTKVVLYDLRHFFFHFKTLWCFRIFFGRDVFEYIIIVDKKNALLFYRRQKPNPVQFSKKHWFSITMYL